MGGNRTGRLEELIRALDACQERSGYLDIMRTAVVPLVELEPFSSWNDKHYTRNVIVHREAYELLLICFEKGQRTSIHDYNTESAFVKPVVGAVREERYEVDGQGGLMLIGTSMLDSGQISHLHNGHSIHRYTNVFPGRSMTMNLYARPLRKWKVYDERSGGSHLGPAGT